jgi:hypothetical protein
MTLTYACMLSGRSLLLLIPEFKMCREALADVNITDDDGNLPEQVCELLHSRCSCSSCLLFLMFFGIVTSTAFSTHLRILTYTLAKLPSGLEADSFFMFAAGDL